MTLFPGYGTEKLHLGQSVDVLEKQLGPPESRSSEGSFREYWLYPSVALEGIVSRRSGRILSLFFRKQTSFVDKGLFGLNEAEVRESYSEPSHVGGGFQSKFVGYIGRWMTYDSGIGFYFDEAGLVETISVFARKRKAVVSSKRKSKGKSATASQSPQIAALRRA